MDKNSAIGLTLILLIFLGFSFLQRPSEEEIAEANANAIPLRRWNRKRNGRRPSALKKRLNR